jgi:hypothetical protein
MHLATVASGYYRPPGKYESSAVRIAAEGECYLTFNVGTFLMISFFFVFPFRHSSLTGTILLHSIQHQKVDGESLLDQIRNLPA